MPTDEQLRLAWSRMHNGVREQLRYRGHSNGTTIDETPIDLWAEAPVPTPGQFVVATDVGPQSATNGHTPQGSLTTWTGSTVISASSKARDPDGWMRFTGVQFNSSVRIATPNVHFRNCSFSAGSNVSTQGLLYSSSSAPSGQLLIEYCSFNQGTSGNSAACLNVFQPMVATVRYSRFEGAGDGIKANSNCLYEHNLILVTGNDAGHVDGIQGEYFKFNWTARHNTILGGVVPSASALAAGASNDRGEKGANIGIYAPVTANGSVGPSGSQGVVAEDNYIDGFNTGISLQGSVQSNPHIIRRNTFGKNFRYYPGLRIRTWTEWPHVVVENNQVYDQKLNETTGQTGPY